MHVVLVECLNRSSERIFAKKMRAKFGTTLRSETPGCPTGMIGLRYLLEKGPYGPAGVTSERRDKRRSSKRKGRDYTGEEVDDKELRVVLSVINELLEEIEVCR